MCGAKPKHSAANKSVVTSTLGMLKVAMKSIERAFEREAKEGSKKNLWNYMELSYSFNDLSSCG